MIAAWRVRRAGPGYVVVGPNDEDAPGRSYFGLRSDADQRALDLNLAIDRGEAAAPALGDSHQPSPARPQP